MMSKAVRLSEIGAERVGRIPTGFAELDYIFGWNEGSLDWGMPTGRMTFCPGKSGIGKTRAWLEVAKRMSQLGMTVLIFTGETPPAQLKAEKFGGFDSANIYVSEATSLTDQAMSIRAIKPHFCLVDSVQMIDEFGTGTAAKAKHVSNEYRSAISTTGTHVVFIGQLDKEGKPKGGTTFPHLCDIILTVHKDDIRCSADNRNFVVAVADKHRYGRTEIATVWRHYDWGVDCWTTERMTDERWRNYGSKHEALSARFNRAEKVEVKPKTPIRVKKSSFLLDIMNILKGN